MLLIFLVILEKCVQVDISRSTPPRARLYIVEPGPKIVPADAGAEKNSRKEIKRVKTSIFLYFFVVF